MISINLYCCEKNVYPYKFIDDWEKFNGTSISGNKDLVVALISKLLQVVIAIKQTEFVKILK